MKNIVEISAKVKDWPISQLAPPPPHLIHISDCASCSTPIFWPMSGCPLSGPGSYPAPPCPPRPSSYRGRTEGLPAASANTLPTFPGKRCFCKTGWKKSNFSRIFFRGEGGEQSVLPGDFDPNLEGRFCYLSYRSYFGCIWF